MRYIDPVHFTEACSVLASYKPPKTVYSVTVYINSKTVVRATWRFKPRSGNRRDEMVVTFGEPNYLERANIKRWKANGEDIPKEAQVRLWPRKAKKAK